MPFINDTTDLLDIKTIDKERGIILRYVPPSMPDVASSFVLEWGDHKIRFGGQKEIETITGDQGVKFNYTWNIHSIALPEAFNETEDTLFQIITEALDAFGDFYDRERVETITVNFDPNVFDSESDSPLEDFA